MSAKKLGRLAGLVFVFAVMFGGAASVGTPHVSSVSESAVASTDGIVDWD